MKSLGWILFAVSFVWAGAASYQVWRLKNSPVVVNVSPSVAGGDARELNQMEKLSFIRQFVDRYTTFDHDNFWQSQVALSFLMAPPLREERLQEINRLKDKIQRNSTDQKGRVVSISIRDGVYHVVADIDLLEGKKKIPLTVDLELELQENARNLDNPWGMVVAQFKSQVQNRKAPAFQGAIGIKQGQPLILSFPCAVENFEIPDSRKLRVKITTFNVSEIQLYSLQEDSGEMNLKAYCRDKEYRLTAKSGAQNIDLFAEVPEGSGLARNQGFKKKPVSSPYQKTIENELGFVIED